MMIVGLVQQFSLIVDRRQNSNIFPDFDESLKIILEILFDKNEKLTMFHVHQKYISCYLFEWSDGLALAGPYYPAKPNSGS